MSKQVRLLARAHADIMESYSSVATYLQRKIFTGVYPEDSEYLKTALSSIAVRSAEYESLLICLRYTKIDKLFGKPSEQHNMTCQVRDVCQRSQKLFRFLTDNAEEKNIITTFLYAAEYNQPVHIQKEPLFAVQSQI